MNQNSVAIIISLSQYDKLCTTIKKNINTKTKDHMVKEFQD